MVIGRSDRGQHFFSTDIQYKQYMVHYTGWAGVDGSDSSRFLSDELGYGHHIISDTMYDVYYEVLRINIKRVLLHCRYQTRTRRGEGCCAAAAVLRHCFCMISLLAYAYPVPLSAVRNRRLL